MCLLLLAVRQHPRWRLVIAANRDEFYARPTAAAAFWPDAPSVLAGRDLVHGGAWLGITRAGRVAALTNFRDPAAYGPDRPSRGHLVSDFLVGDEAPETYLARVAERADRYNGFSLIVGCGDALWYYSNRGPERRQLKSGVYGLSNHLIDTPWPKVTRAKNAVTALLSDAVGPTPQRLFALLGDHTVAADADLPATGVGLERERMLSPLFVAGTEYGTRSSTVVLIDEERHVTLIERTFQGDPARYTAVTHRFRIGPDAGPQPA